MPIAVALLASLIGGLPAPRHAFAADQAPVAAPPLATTLGEWNGEFFTKKQGGFYLRTQLKGFKSGAMAQVRAGNLQITLWNALTKALYVVTQSPQDEGTAFRSEATPRHLFKAPSGKYFIKQIAMVDDQGVLRRWRDSGDDHRAFSIKRQCLSNLGRWVISPVGKDALALTLESLPNSYKETGPKGESSVAVVIDGFTGLIQQVFGGKKVLEGADSDFSGEHQLRATVTFTRQIQMFYKLDLFMHNRYGKSIAAVLDTYDGKLRQCYTDRLEWNDSLRGELKFAFLLSKRTGTMVNVKQAGGSIKDPKMVECIYFALQQIQFPVPENMVGELTYTYDVK